MGTEKELEKKFSEWKEETYASFKESRGERKESFGTSSGFRIDPLYTPLHSPDSEYLEKSGFPGCYPFTRGVYPTLYRGRLWTMRQYAGFGSAAETNARFKYLLEKGQTGLSVAFDLPTQMGLDSDDERSAGEVGKVGVAIDSMDDFRTLFSGIPLDKVSTSMTINSTAAILLAMYAALAEETGVPVSGISGTIQNDILKEYYARGTYIYPPEESMRIITDIFAWCRENTPRWNTISISGYHIREAGSTAAEEVAFTLSDAVTYIEAALTTGLDIDEFAPRLSFFFGVHNNLFEEVAKFRAARRIYARIMKERFGARKKKSMMLRFHSQTAGCSLTAQQIENNVVRVTIQALAAVLGGTQSLHTNSKDEALTLPSEDSVLTALRTQQLLATEAGVSESIDPLGGSYFIEKMTDDLEERILELMNKVEEMGGMIKAIEQHFPQRQIEKSAYRYQKEIESGDRVIVGVNKYKVDESIVQADFSVDEEVEKRHVASLARFKKSRDSALVENSLEEVEKVASGDDNLMPPIIRAVKNGCTVGEISGRLEKVFGRYKPSVHI
ncbi:MAG: methylmalonyl-CoA mutase [Candidatus Latescibacteria bacterium]|nr:methylmalonyl-CoA mutase [bacterium]MBD3425570.1 methylmalonyl-CoA mutase [Candidatus Latescibacterota bacterium]